MKESFTEVGPTYWVVRMLCQDVCEQFWHPLLDRVGVAVHKGTDTQNSSMPLSQCFIITRILSSWYGTAVQQPQKSVLYFISLGALTTCIIPPTHLQSNNTLPRR